jgi:hypothetical protein
MLCIMYFDTSENKTNFSSFYVSFLPECAFIYMSLSIERSSFMERYFERTSFMDVIRSFMEYIRAFMEYIYKGMHICAESNGDIAKTLLLYEVHFYQRY